MSTITLFICLFFYSGVGHVIAEVYRHKGRIGMFITCRILVAISLVSAILTGIRLITGG